MGEIDRIREWRDNSSLATALDLNLVDPRDRAVVTAQQWRWNDVDVLLKEVDRLREAEAIVRGLADAPLPVVGPNVDRMESGPLVCVLCGAQVSTMPAEHAESCPWRRAREWVDQQETAT